MTADYQEHHDGTAESVFLSVSTPEAVKTRVINEVISRPPETAVTILKGMP